MCYFDDDGSWVTLKDVWRVARKRRRCDECQGWIQARERYHYVFGLSDGESYDSSTCQSCETGPCVWLTRVCGGYYMGMVEEDLREHLREERALDAGDYAEIGPLLDGMAARRRLTANTSTRSEG